MQQSVEKWKTVMEPMLSGAKEKDNPFELSFLGSGGWIRTNDLRVMSPTSYLCSTPHSVIP